MHVSITSKKNDSVGVIFFGMQCLFIFHGYKINKIYLADKAKRAEMLNVLCGIGKSGVSAKYIL